MERIKFKEQSELVDMKRSELIEYIRSLQIQCNTLVWRANTDEKIIMDLQKKVIAYQSRGTRKEGAE